MAENPKRENLFNLALDASAKELEQSPQLGLGYDSVENTWEFIIRSTQELSGLQEDFPDAMIVPLLNGYAVVTLPLEQLEAFTERIEIEYMEKPKRLFFAVDQGKRASCIVPVQAGARGLSGRGVLLGIADSGIDWSHPDFIDASGKTRIAAIWDQTLQPMPSLGLEPPTGYDRGVELSREQIGLALSGSEDEASQILRSQAGDGSGHGTHVAGIAAGNGRASNGRYRGVAYESELLVVRLGRPREGGFPSTVELMLAVDYMIKKALELRRPIAVNLSFGNNYGSHSGSSLLETYLNSLSGYWKNVIVAGSGNEGRSRSHASGRLKTGMQETVPFSVSPYETSLSIQIWKSYADEVSLYLLSPSGRSAGPIPQVLGPQRFTLGQTKVLLYYGEPSPYSPYQEIYLELLPEIDYIDSGIWELGLSAGKIRAGTYDLWLPGGGSLNAGTGFLYPTQNTTLTIPSTAEKIISVAAYDSRRNQAADFSGRGYTRQTNQVKPDLAAPGVDIVSAAVGGGYATKSGTSMAAPFVSGSAALLMQWGIVNGNDPYLYGEKIKAYLLKGAKPIPAIAQYPNPQLGWGVLCLEDSLPG